MTDKQIGNIIDSMVVIVDTREKANKHIIDWLKENNIKYEIEKLDSCDYSFKLYGEYSHLSKSILVERKNSLDELAGNFSINRSRFESFLKICKNKSVRKSVRPTNPVKSMLCDFFLTDITDITAFLPKVF